MTRALPRPDLRSDTTRYWLSTTVAAVIVGAIAAVVAATTSADVLSLPGLVSIYFGSWAVFCAVYTAATVVAFNRADRQTLAAWFAETAVDRRRRRLNELLSGSGGASGAISFCAIAVAAVVATAVVTELRDNPLVIVLAFLVVAATWVMIVVVYAVQYTREDLNLGGLRFPDGGDDGPPLFSDYFYLAVQLGTTFATSDVQVTTRGMRRMVTAHSIIAFTFNTVVIALLVSLLIAVGT